MSTPCGYQAFGYTSPIPNATDFATMLTTEIGLTAGALTTAAIQVTASLAYAQCWVYKRLNCISNGIYLRAVYCLATDRLLNIGQDPTNNSTTFFASLRTQFAITSFIAGVISSSSDESTSQSIAVAESLNTLTLPDLQNLKTPWGREYLGYAQQGAPIWGVS